MIETGVSVYLGLKEYNLKDNIEYLKKCKNLGIDNVFSSLHINEAINNTSLDEFTIQARECKELGLKLNVDISKPTFEKINVPEGIYRLRLDYGFSKEEIVEMSNIAPYLIELNASTINEEYVKELFHLGANTSRLSFSFNFYPKKYTGHDSKTVYEKIELIHKYGFKVYAFVRSFYGLRPPLYEGLPTIENHRYESLTYSVEELTAMGIDGLYFGDAYASDDEIKELVSLSKEDNLIVEVYSLDDDAVNSLTSVYVNRRDFNDYLIRIGTLSRNTEVKPNNVCVTPRHKLDLTIDNSLFKRYSGEINIVLQDLPSDERCNLIGRIYTSDFVLEKIKNCEHFKFKVVSKDNLC